MEKRRALAGAGAITVTAVTATLAIGAAFGMGGFSDASSKTGRLSPSTKLTQADTTPAATPIVETIVVDVPAATGSGGRDPSVGAPSAPPATDGTDDDRDAIDATATSVEPTASPTDDHWDDSSDDEDSHSDEDDPAATDDHANEDEHEGEDD